MAHVQNYLCLRKLMYTDPIDRIQDKNTSIEDVPCLSTDPDDSDEDSIIG